MSKILNHFQAFYLWKCENVLMRTDSNYDLGRLIFKIIVSGKTMAVLSFSPRVFVVDSHCQYLFVPESAVELTLS